MQKKLTGYLTATETRQKFARPKPVALSSSSGLEQTWKTWFIARTTVYNQTMDLIAMTFSDDCLTLRAEIKAYKQQEKPTKLEDLKSI